MSQIDKFKDAIAEISAAATQILADASTSENVSFIVVGVDHTNNPNNRVIVLSDLQEHDVEAVLQSVVSQSDEIGAVMGRA